MNIHSPRELREMAYNLRHNGYAPDMADATRESIAQALDMRATALERSTSRELIEPSIRDVRRFELVKIAFDKLLDRLVELDNGRGPLAHMANIICTIDAVLDEMEPHRYHDTQPKKGPTNGDRR